jgi:hypothetical protein
MYTGKTAATGLAITPVACSPLAITATRIAMGIKKTIPPTIVVLMSFSMMQALLPATSGAPRSPTVAMAGAMVGLCSREHPALMNAASRPRSCLDMDVPGMALKLIQQVFYAKSTGALLRRPTYATDV